MRRTWVVLAAGVLAAAVLTACAGKTAGPAGLERVIYMSAVEYKGGATVDKEPFPGQAPPEGYGYILKEPNKEGRWETSTYRWEPGTVVVRQGDRVTLHIWGVNGATHHSSIEHYVKDFVVRRGQLTQVSFTADRPGSFQIVCDDHMPSMQGQIVVLPRR